MVVNIVLWPWDQDPCGHSGNITHNVFNNSCGQRWRRGSNKRTQSKEWIIYYGQHMFKGWMRRITIKICE